MKKFLVLFPCLLLLAACAGGPRPELPSGPQAYEVIPEGSVTSPRRQVLGPNDVISIQVFRERDLSVDKATIDTDGSVQVPLLGPVRADGLTAGEFARDLEQRFGSQFLVDPRVTVSVIEPALRQVTVTGAVTSPGVFNMPSRISLLDAVALARGTTDIAKFNQVVVFRRVNGERVGGLFDLAGISAGRDPDIEIEPGDQVIVGTDSMKVAFRNVLQTAPLLSTFVIFATRR